MSAQRLTFLYPHLFRTACESATAASRSTSRAKRPRPARQHVASFGTSTASKKASFAPRVGKGIEPKPLGSVQGAPALESHMKDALPPPPPEARDSTPEQRKDAAKALDPATDALKKTLSSPGVSASEKKKQREQAQQEQQAQQAQQVEKAQKEEKEQQERKEQAQTQVREQENEQKQEAGADSAATSPDGGAAKKKRATGPMDAVLHIEPPENQPAEEKPPHLTPPPYVHHFDSYSLVKQLEQGGYTNAQAITAMKGVRALLAQNLDVAQGGLISKSDVENETYLFRAACAELSTEVKNNRRIADEQLRQQRTVLQHEVDNTTQVMNQELLTLNDNVKGMFNDRKMAVREEQKAAESAVCPPPVSSDNDIDFARCKDIDLDFAHLHRHNKLHTRSASR